jgi:ATP-dependent protease ClpP protease subunit
MYKLTTNDNNKSIKLMGSRAFYMNGKDNMDIRTDDNLENNRENDIDIKEENKRFKSLGKKESKKESETKTDINEYGDSTLGGNGKQKVYLLTIIGEIEGHEVLSNSSKSTKYEHVLPKLAQIEDDPAIEGVLLLINTMGGDVEAGLAIAEMIASLSKPSVSLVLGGSHSIGVPIATSTDYSFIVPTGTMVIHPVRMNGLFIGVQQTYDYFKIIQDRIVGFISEHSLISRDRIEELTLNQGMLTKGLGTILVGKEAVDEGIINEVGGMKEAMKKLHELIDLLGK